MQSKRMSFIEAKTNAVVGLLVSWLFTYFCLPWFGLEPSRKQRAVQFTRVYDGTQPRGGPDAFAS